MSYPRQTLLMLLISIQLDLVIHWITHNRTTNYPIFLQTHRLLSLRRLAPNQYPKVVIMGNSKSEVDFAINLDKEFYFASELVKGQLLLNAKKRYPCARIILEIEGIQSCDFRTTDGQQAKGLKKLINTSHILQEFGHNQFLQGQHVLPFSFRFLEYLPGSYDETKGYKAKVGYTIKAIVISKERSAERLQKSVQVIIRQPQRQGDKMLYGQTFINCKSCFCLDKGVSKVQCYFQKNYYLPGQDCIMICETDNTKCGLALSRIKCQFIKEVTLTALNGSQRTFTQLLNTVYFPGCRPYGSYFGENAQRQTINLRYSKDLQKGLSPSTHGHYVRCQYYILVEPLYGGCCNKTVDNQFKVYLTILQPAMTYQPIQQPQNWRPSIAQSSNFYLNFDKAGSSNELLSSMDSRSY